MIQTTAIPKELTVGGHVLHTPTAITVSFDEIRYAISTGALNGGLHHVLAVRNQHLGFFVESEKELPGGSLSGYLTAEFEQDDFPPNFCTGLITSATMERAAYTLVKAGTTSIEVIATAGFEATAHRAGDGYKYEETNGHFQVPGTINLLIFTNKALTDGALTRAVITATEAKTLALQEAGITMLNSTLPASGTATDGLIMTIDPHGEILTDTGSFSLFGDTLAKAVRQALAQAIYNAKASE